MELAKKDQEKVIKWIKDKCGQMRCFCCGEGQWTVASATTVAIGYNVHTTRFHYHQGIPTVTLVCSNCGHMVHFNAVVLGFQPDTPKVHQVQGDGDTKKGK